MKPSTHRFYEDVLALLSASVFVALGVLLFNSHGLLAGGTAGIALVSANLFPISFGALFFMVNLPFYYLAWTQLGKRFTINTFISVSLVSFLSEYIHQVIKIENVHPAFAALVGGMLIGVGLLIMFRHKSSLGGLGILAFYLQNRFNIRAGKVQLAVDCCILTVAFIAFPMEVVALSIGAAITTNIVLAVNHKPGRYQADLAVATTDESDALISSQAITEDLINEDLLASQSIAQIEDELATSHRVNSLY